jgi:hypothetical protein
MRTGLHHDEPRQARSRHRHGIVIVSYYDNFPVPGLTKGGGSIESTSKKQNENGGIPRDIVRVDAGEQPFNPDRDVLRKTEVHGIGVRSPSRKKPVKPGGDDDGTHEN